MEPGQLDSLGNEALVIARNEAPREKALAWSCAESRPKTSTGRLMLCSEMVLLKLKLKLMLTLILKLEASLELVLCRRLRLRRKSSSSIRRPPAGSPPMPSGSWRARPSRQGWRNQRGPVTPPTSSGLRRAPLYDLRHRYLQSFGKPLQRR